MSSKNISQSYTYYFLHLKNTKCRTNSSNFSKVQRMLLRAIFRETIEWALEDETILEKLHTKKNKNI